MNQFTPCLWFDSNAEEAVAFYTSIFKNSKINSVSHYDKASAEVSGRPLGSVMAIGFELDGQAFLALNGGPVYTFTPAISFIANCQNQAEVDELWEKLAEGGEKESCGWIRDKYGVSWQIVPTILEELLLDKDPAKAERVMQAMLRMTKLDIEVLKQA
jgi:predicted 3-demethylubiquinone-9 3-methyltransferase (glyoxalase superfamily)